jgi:hypothetical protein
MKATRATIKAFIKRNRDRLLVSVKSQFDGTVDGVVSSGDCSFSKAIDSYNPHENNQNIAGIWLVGGGRDYITPFFRDGLSGFEVVNCCGKWSIAIKS